jgi:hypothetical protein
MVVVVVVESNLYRLSEFVVFDFRWRFLVFLIYFLLCCTFERMMLSLLLMLRPNINSDGLRFVVVCAVIRYCIKNRFSLMLMSPGSFDIERKLYYLNKTFGLTVGCRMIRS